jgi:predicted transcriptional regulator
VLVLFASTLASAKLLRSEEACIVPDDVDLRKVVANVAAAYFRTNRVRPADIPIVIGQIIESLAAISPASVETPALTPVTRLAAGVEREDGQPSQRALSAAQIRASVTPQALISFEDGNPHFAR